MGVFDLKKNIIAAGLDKEDATLWNNLMAYEAGYFDRADVTRLGLGMLAATILVILLALQYWALLGVPLTSS